MASGVWRGLAAMVCVWLSWTGPSHAQGDLVETPPLRFSDVRDGLPSSRVVGFAQDREGYLWIATEDGLARFDGIGYRVHRYAPGSEGGMPGDNVQVLHRDADDNLWMGIEGQGITRLSADRREFKTWNQANLPLLRSDDVFAIASRGSELWFGTFGGGLYRRDAKGVFTRFQANDAEHPGLPDDNIISLTSDTSGALWIGTTSGLVRWDGQDFERPTALASIDMSVISLHADAEGLWIGTRTALFLYAPDGSLSQPTWQQGLPSRNVLATALDADGARWLGTAAGLCLLRDQRLDCPSAAREVVRALWLDRDGGHWFGFLGKGLAYLPRYWRGAVPLAWRSADRDEALKGFRIAVQDDALWVCGRSGMLWRISADSTLQRDLGFSCNGLSAVDARRLWWGGVGRLTLLDGDVGTLREYRADSAVDRLPDAPLQHLRQDSDDRLWVAAMGYGLQLRDAQGRLLQDFPAGETSGLLSGDVRDVALDAAGNPWVATDQGVFRFDATARRFRLLTGPADGAVMSLAFDGKGVLWLHQRESLSAWRWEGGSAQRLMQHGLEEGLPAVASSGLTVDASGVVWLSTQRGLLRFDPLSREMRMFGVRDGLPGQEFLLGAAVPDAQGDLLLASPEGLVRIDPRALAERDPLPEVSIDTLLVQRGEDRFELPWLPATPLQLQPEDRELRVSARLLRFEDPATHRFRFQLEGFDPDWVEVEAAGERVISQLPPGSYRLRIIASTDGRSWTEPRVLKLRKLPAWWQTWWARALALVLVIGVLVVSFLRYRAGQKQRSRLALIAQREEMALRGSESKTRFLADLGHEIRTPMTSVLGMAELLQAGQLDERQRGQVRTLQGAGRHLLRLIDDALDLSRIEAGKLELLHEPVRVDELLDEVAAWLRPLAETKGLQLRLHRALGVADAVLGDPQRLRQILSNLGNNAVKFTARGVVEIDCAPLLPQGLRIEVRDTGPGMDDEQLAKLFQRFEQAEGARTASRHGGSGLGLAICKELVEAMGGRIDVESAPGKGSVFRVLLPLPASDADLPRAVSDQAPSSEIATKSLEGLRVLLVEDEAEVAEVLCGLLVTLGCQVRHAPQALAALAELQNGGIDVVVCDLDLPGMDGIALASLLRSQQVRLPLLALTARADAAAESQCRQAGFDGFARKPVTAAMLADALCAVQLTAGRGAAHSVAGLSSA